MFLFPNNVVSKLGLARARKVVDILKGAVEKTSGAVYTMYTFARSKEIIRDVEETTDSGEIDVRLDLLQRRSGQRASDIDYEAAIRSSMDVLGDKAHPTLTMLAVDRISMVKLRRLINYRAALNRAKPELKILCIALSNIRANRQLYQEVCDSVWFLNSRKSLAITQDEMTESMCSGPQAASPSGSPTEMPTTSPTKTPTSSPNTLSLAPTMSPTKVCEDTTQMFLFPNNVVSKLGLARARKAVGILKGAIEKTSGALYTMYTFAQNKKMIRDVEETNDSGEIDAGLDLLQRHSGQRASRIDYEAAIRSSMDVLGDKAHPTLTMLAVDSISRAKRRRLINYRAALNRAKPELKILCVALSNIRANRQLYQKVCDSVWFLNSRKSLAITQDEMAESMCSPP